MALDADAINEAVDRAIQEKLLPLFGALGIPSHHSASWIAFIREAAHESPRGMALFAAAFLDEALHQLLKTFLVQDRIAHDLIGGRGSMSSFGARARLAFSLGLISRHAYNDLNTIAQIRNAFAHKTSARSFDDLSIAKHCEALTLSAGAEGARAKYQTALFSVVGMVCGATEHIRENPSLVLTERGSSLPSESDAARNEFARAVRTLVHSDDGNDEGAPADPSK